MSKAKPTYRQIEKRLVGRLRAFLTREMPEFFDGEDVP